MSRWEDQLNKHPIHDTLDWLESTVQKEVAEIDGAHVAEKRRLTKIIQAYRESLKTLDPELIPFNQLDSLNTGLRNPNVANQVNAYQQSGNVANLVELNNQVSNLLTQMSLLLNLSPRDSSQVHDQVRDLERLVDSTATSLTKKKEELSAAINKLIAAEKTTRQKFSELSSSIDQKRSEIDALASEWQSQFSTAQDSRSQEYNRWRETISSENSAKVSSAIDGYKKSLEESKDELNEKITQILKDGQEKHQSILELYQLTAGDSVAAGYLSSANSEKEQADNWRLISVSFIVLTVAWMLFAYFNTTTDKAYSLTPLKVPSAQVIKDSAPAETNEPTSQAVIQEPSISTSFPWFRLLVTFSLSGVLLWGSAYAAQQSTKHRNNEKRTRWFALEVKAIDPFISSLSEDQRNQLKRQLSEKIFGQFTNNMDDNTKVVDEHAFKTVANTISAILSKLPK